MYGSIHICYVSQLIYYPCVFTTEQVQNVIVCLTVVTYSMYPPDIPSHYTVHAFLMLRSHILTMFNLSSMYVFFLILIFTLILIISIHGRAVSSTALRV